MTAPDKFRRAMHEIAKHKGEFTLFGLFLRADAPLMRAEDPDTWDLLVSAPWLERGRLKAHGELVGLLERSLGRRVLQRLSRVETVPGIAVRSIVKRFRVEDGELHIQDTDLLGVQVEKGIIFRSWRPSKKTQARKERLPAAAAD